MRVRTVGRFATSLFSVLLAFGFFCSLSFTARSARASPLDDAVVQALLDHGFTGRIESTLEQRLGRPIDRTLADVGRLLWFDTIAGLNDDNGCGGCHSPMNGFGDTQSIAIGIDNNGIVGPGRAGPRNQRRTPSVINAAMFPRLMWNGRFAALSGDPFDNSLGFSFPLPEGLSLSGSAHLLVAQAFIPPTERTEAAGFAFQGTNDDMRAQVVSRLNDTPGYVEKFAEIYPSVQAGGPITYEMFASAIAELEQTLVFANAPIDRFARGHQQAMTDAQKRGAVLFFGKAKCVSCHAVSGDSNEMFSDFDNHVIGVPQIVPTLANITFDGPGQNEDFGLEQVTGNPADRYKFRSAPLRNLAAAAAFMHNGAFTTLESAIQHHLDVPASVATFTTSHLDADLQNPIAPMAGVLANLDPLLAAPIALTSNEFADLVDFVRNGLSDDRAKQSNLERLIPASVPSGRPMVVYESVCFSDAECTAREYCDGSGCVPKGAVFDACSGNVECESGLCQSGACATPANVTCKNVLRGVFGNVNDAFVSGDFPTYAPGGTQGAWTGESTGGNENFALIRFDLSFIPATAKIRSAVARVNVAWNDSAMEIASHPVLGTSSWVEKVVTYERFVKPGAWDTMPFTQVFAGGIGYKDLDLTALASDWVSGKLTNRGVLLREPKHDAHYLYTSEASQSSLRPRIRVCYSN